VSLLRQRGRDGLTLFESLLAVDDDDHGQPQRRHNAIANQLAAALPSSVVKVLLDRDPLGSNGVRPDLSVWNADGKIVLAEVSCPYEGHEDVLEASFQRKASKYAALACTLATDTVRSVVCGRLSSAPRVADTQGMSLASRIWVFIMDVRHNVVMTHWTNARLAYKRA